MIAYVLAFGAGFLTAAALIFVILWALTNGEDERLPLEDKIRGTEYPKGRG